MNILTVSVEDVRSWAAAFPNTKLMVLGGSPPSQVTKGKGELDMTSLFFRLKTWLTNIFHWCPVKLLLEAPTCITKADRSRLSKTVSFLRFLRHFPLPPAAVLVVQLGGHSTGRCRDLSLLTHKAKIGEKYILIVTFGAKIFFSRVGPWQAVQNTGFPPSRLRSRRLSQASCKPACPIAANAICTIGSKTDAGFLLMFFNSNTV